MRKRGDSGQLFLRRGTARLRNPLAFPRCDKPRVDIHDPLAFGSDVAIHKRDLFLDLADSVLDRPDTPFERRAYAFVRHLEADRLKLLFRAREPVARFFCNPRRRCRVLFAEHLLLPEAPYPFASFLPPRPQTVHGRCDFAHVRTRRFRLAHTPRRRIARLLGGGEFVALHANATSLFVAALLGSKEARLHVGKRLLASAKRDHLRLDLVKDAQSAACRERRLERQHRIGVRFRNIYVARNPFRFGWHVEVFRPHED